MTDQRKINREDAARIYDVPQRYVLEPPMTDGDVVIGLGGVVVLIALAIPRRTRLAAGVLYGVWLSRGHGRARGHLERTLLRLFDERTAAHVRMDGLEGRLRDVEAGRFSRAGAAVDRGYCPACDSGRVVDADDHGGTVVIDRRTLTCRDCGARWIGRRRERPPQPAPSARS